MTCEEFDRLCRGVTEVQRRNLGERHPFLPNCDPSSPDTCWWCGKTEEEHEAEGGVNAKAKGSRRELQARRILEAAGYYVVKAGGSLGLWDLVALGPAGVRLVQVKSNGKPRPAERERLELFPRLPYCSKELWVFYDRQREPVVERL